MIFCVEDDPNIRELEVYTLQSVGFKALGVGSGDELFKELGCTKPTLILLDIMLPGDDGITLLKRLRSDKRTAQVPVIMATAPRARNLTRCTDWITVLMIILPNLSA